MDESSIAFVIGNGSVFLKMERSNGVVSLHIVSFGATGGSYVCGFMFRRMDPFKRRNHVRNHFKALPCLGYQGRDGKGRGVKCWSRGRIIQGIVVPAWILRLQEDLR